MHRRRGFTLIELLVVIAVIAIIAAILFPVFAQAREKARQATCLSNLRQIGAATMLYLQDYDETYPGGPGVYGLMYPGPEGSWEQMRDRQGRNVALISVAPRLAPYLKSKQVFVEPNNPDGLSGGTWDTRFTRQGYGWPQTFSEGTSWTDYPTSPGKYTNPRRPLTLAEVRAPATLFMLGDALPRPLPHTPRTLQEARANFVYADGHAKFTRWVDDWLPANQRPWAWSFYNPRQPVQLEKPCTPTCAEEAARN